MGSIKLPDAGLHLIFYLPMPKSWNAKKRREHDGQPHQQKRRNDWDNLAKAFCDALWEEDGSIWDCRVTSFWSSEPRIEVMLYEDKLYWEAMEQLPHWYWDGRGCASGPV